MHLSYHKKSAFPHSVSSAASQLRIIALRLVKYSIATAVLYVIYRYWIYFFILFLLTVLLILFARLYMSSIKDDDDPEDISNNTSLKI